MSYPPPLVFSDALEKSGVSFHQLASNFIDTLKSILQAEPAVISHDTVIQYSEGLLWAIRGLKEDAVYSVGSGIIGDVIIPYLIAMSSDSVPQTPPSMRAVAKLFAGLMCSSTRGVELVEGVLVPLLVALCTHESVQLQTKFNDTDQLLIPGGHLNPYLVLVMFQAIFHQGTTAYLEKQLDGSKAVAALFLQALELFKSLPAVCCQLLACSVLPLLVTQQSVHHFIELLWKLVEAVNNGRTTVASGKNEFIQTILCCFSDLFIGRDKASPFISAYDGTLCCTLPVRDVRVEEAFLAIIQVGLVSPEPLERKRCRYLLHRVIVSTEGVGRLGSQAGTFWWQKEHDGPLRAVWTDIILLLETLEEKAVHIVLPVLSRLKSLGMAVNTEMEGHRLLHLSWLEVVFTRVIGHESKSVIKWGVSEFLKMHTSVSSPQHWKFILGPLLCVLNKSIIYERDASERFSGCPAVVTSWNGFLGHFVGALPKDSRGTFIYQFICACWTLKLVDVPLVYVSYSLSLLPPMPILDPLSLQAIRLLVQGSLHTIKATLRQPIQGFLLTAVCSLTNLEAVSYGDIFSTLGCFCNSECLVYGSNRWEQVTGYLREFCLKSKGSQTLCCYLCGAIEEGLQEHPGVTTPTPSQTALAVVLALSTQEMYPGDSLLVSVGQPTEEVLAVLLGPMMDTIVSASNRPYLSHYVVVRAVEVIVGVVEMLLVEKKSGNLDTLLYKYMSPWLPSLFTHCEHELLQGSQNGFQPDLDHTLLYKRAINGIYLFASNFSFPVSVNSLKDHAFELFKKNEQSVELTGAFLGAITGLAWLASLPRGTQDQRFCYLLVAMEIKKPKVSMSWEAQPNWSLLYHHCLSAYWQCVLHTLQLVGSEIAPLNDGTSARTLAEACMNSADLIGGNMSVLISCLEHLAPKLESDILLSCVDRLWAVLAQYKTTPYFSDTLSAFISLCFNRSFDKLNSVPIFSMQAKYIGKITELGQGKSRAYMLLVEHLCTTWLVLLKSDPALLVPSLERHTPVVLDACFFGPIYRKNLRLFEDTQLFISSLAPSQPGMSENKRQDCYVRVRMLTFLLELASQLGDQTDVMNYLMGLVVLMAEKLLQLSIDNPKYYTNTCIHRVKLRLIQAMLVLVQWVDKPTSGQIIKLLLKCLRYDNQVSVRYLMEWMTALIFCHHPDLLEPLFYPCLQQECDIRSSRMSSVFTVALHVSRNLPSMEHKTFFYHHVLKSVFPWCCNHNFTLRLYAQQLLVAMWGEAPVGVSNQYSMVGCAVSYMTHSRDLIKALHKLQDNVFFTHLSITEDLNIQTIFEVLPQLTGVIEEEWLQVVKAFKAFGGVWERGVVIESSNQVLLELTKMITDKTDTGKEAHQDSCDDDDDDVQRKISVMSGGGLLGEIFPELPLSQQQPKGALILVASLVQKIPNLGGLCRTCEVFGVAEMVVENLSVLEDREFQSLSVTAEKWLGISEVKVHAIPKYLSGKREEGYSIIGLEQTAESCNVAQHTFKHKTVLVLGNEHLGIPVEVLHLMDECLEAPQFGIIRSLNVHVAGAIAIWEYTRQHCIHKSY